MRHASAAASRRLAAAALALALAAAAGTPAAARTASAPPGPVLVYVWHQVAPPGWPLTHGPDTITPTQFAQECAWIARRHIATLSAGEFLAYIQGRYRPTRLKLYLTFDNGLEGVYRYAFPILVRDHIHATVFIITGRTTKDHAGGVNLAYLTWPQIHRMLRSRLVDIQAEASGLHNTILVAGRPEPLVYRMPGESPAAYARRLAQDFAAQRRAFLDHLHYAPRLLVWPFSAWTPAAEAAGRRFGIDVFFRVGLGFAEPGQGAAVARNSASLGWQDLGLSVTRMLGGLRTGAFDHSLHYFWGDPSVSA